jgi:hypothetical protein
MADECKLNPCNLVPCMSNILGSRVIDAGVRPAISNLWIILKSAISICDFQTILRFFLLL